MNRLQRPTLGVLGLVLLVLVAGCSGATGVGADATGTDGPERSIEVAADGEASAEPDRATVLVAVESTAADPQTVRTELAESDGELRTALYDWGIAEDDVRTERYDIREARGGRDTPDEPTEYTGIHLYAVEVDDVDAVGEVIDVAVGAGADRVERIRFGLSDERADDLREQALTDAMDTARAEADTLAANADLEVTGARTVSTTNVRTAPYTNTAVQAEGDAATESARTGIQTGNVDVTVTVRVVFDARQA
jgi:hypothetical protein